MYLHGERGQVSKWPGAKDLTASARKTQMSWTWRASWRNQSKEFKTYKKIQSLLKILTWKVSQFPHSKAKTNRLIAAWQQQTLPATECHLHWYPTWHIAVSKLLQLSHESFAVFEVVEKSCLLCLIFGVFSILSVNTCADPSLRDLEMSYEESKLSRKSKVQNPESEIENPRSQFWWLFLIFRCTQKTGDLDIVPSPNSQGENNNHHHHNHQRKRK